MKNIFYHILFIIATKEICLNSPLLKKITISEYRSHSNHTTIEYQHKVTFKCSGKHLKLIHIKMWTRNIFCLFCEPTTTSTVNMENPIANGSKFFFFQEIYRI